MCADALVEEGQHVMVAVDVQPHALVANPVGDREAEHLACTSWTCRWHVGGEEVHVAELARMPAGDARRVPHLGRTGVVGPQRAAPAARGCRRGRRSRAPSPRSGTVIARHAAAARGDRPRRLVQRHARRPARSTRSRGPAGSAEVFKRQRVVLVGAAQDRGLASTASPCRPSSVLPAPTRLAERGDAQHGMVQPADEPRGGHRRPSSGRARGGLRNALAGLALRESPAPRAGSAR